jgi:Holliday junction DNA helicase RuvA
VIGLLRGEVALRRSDHVVVLCAGVGYRVAVSAETLRHVAPAGEPVTLHTHLILRDDAITLYGFHSEHERDLFLMLLSVQAVGPKVALGVLSAAPARELAAAIAAGDSARFQAVPGIGRRTAERIIVELKEKLAGELAAGVAGGAIVARSGPRQDPRSLAREGLVELGFAAAEADEMLAGAAGETAEDLIAGALRAAHMAGEGR